MYTHCPNNQSLKLKLLNLRNNSQSSLVEFRISTLLTKSPVELMLKFLSPQNFIDVYNYGWVAFSMGLVTNKRLLALVLGYILLNFSNENPPPFDSFSPEYTPMQPVKYEEFKPLFKQVSEEAVLIHLVPILYGFSREPINLAIKNHLPLYFNKLSLKTRVKLLVLQDQLGINLDSSELLFLLYGLKPCKLLRLSHELSDIDVLFSNLKELFSDIMFVLPLKKPKSAQFRTKWVLSVTYKTAQFEFSCFEERVANFLTTLKFTFSPKNFPEAFKKTLNKYLVVLGLSANTAHNKQVFGLVQNTLSALEGYYSFKYLEAVGSSLKAYKFLNILYKATGNYLAAYKSAVLNGSDPLKVLLKYHELEKQQHIQALMILFCLRASKDSPDSLEKCFSILPGKVSLIKYLSNK